MRTIIILGIGVLLSTAAFAETHTKSWYMAHPQARASVYAACMDNPGGARHNEDCINSAAADEAVAIDRRIARIGIPPTLIDQCANMPPLFQIVNRCGPGGRR